MLNHHPYQVYLESRVIHLPDDLVQIQAYIRWEKAGKPNYSPDQQLLEFEEARKELQVELEKGKSIEAIRNKITKREKKPNVSKNPDTKRFSSVERIQRKKRDLMQLLNKYTPGPVKETVPEKPPTLSAVNLFCKAKEEQSGGPALRKNIYKLADRELLGLEKYVMTKLFTRVYASLPEEVNEDNQLHQKVALIQQFIRPENLDIQPIYQNETSWLID
ncbi:hypothetical protein POM88_017457 [Heracleum sosnowskyi]|uniref:DUF7067 domain-containing protein n=1 Tax=Heracleum sosnowskyi TaxID=360622 RepID=A0AAD8IQI5_9APIA|nr:hypothetical protein POM88_017457 [Heracleum sosnowskyi]